MEIILLEKIRNLGGLGDKVKVKRGYGDNFLIPQGKAVPANAANLAAFQARRAELEAKASEELKVAQAQASKIEGLSVTLEVMASDEGKLYGSINVADVTDAINAKGFEIEKAQVEMPEGAIRALGNYEIKVQFHTDISVPVSIEVIPSK